MFIYELLLLTQYTHTALEGHPLEDVIIMQRYEEGWDGGEWKEKLDFRPCLDKNHFVKVRCFFCINHIKNYFYI